MAKTAHKKKPSYEKIRIRKASKYKSFRLSKKINHPDNKQLPGIYKLYRQTKSLLLSNKKLFFGIIGVNVLLSLIFVTGFSLYSDFDTTKQNLEDALGEGNQLTTSIALFSFLVNSGNSSSSEAGGVYQIFLTLVVSLVIIWSIRQIYAGEKPTVKQSFYQGVYPLVPFLLVLLVVGIQLIPFFIGSFLVSTVFVNSLAVTAAEKVLWILIFLLLSLLSLYMIVSSIFALYIVTLPNATPVQALRSARGLVLNRRISVILRVLGIPVVLLFLYVVILLPLIYFLPFLAVPIFICLSGIALFFVHGYMYNLYRSLL